MFFYSVYSYAKVARIFLVSVQNVNLLQKQFHLTAFRHREMLNFSFRFANWTMELLPQWSNFRWRFPFCWLTCSPSDCAVPIPFALNIHRPHPQLKHHFRQINVNKCSAPSEFQCFPEPSCFPRTLSLNRIRRGKLKNSFHCRRDRHLFVHRFLSGQLSSDGGQC